MNPKKPDHTESPYELWRPFVENRPTIHCSPGFLIYLQGSQAACFYFLKRGRVKSYIQSEDGAEQILAIFESGSLFGEAAFFDELPRVSSAMALTACELIPIDRELVSAQFAQNPALAMNMVRYLARKVRMLSDHLDHIAFRPAKWRVAEYILSLSSSDGWIACNQEEIAGAVGVSRVTTNRIVNEFVRSGLIEAGYRKLRILNQDQLKKFCEESI